ncbi:hypothetical protein QJ854_gp115 [Moumouvirus goulette]|uniref:Uncharacterized protein n=1 Tax=Moumouvirus goulette TaxID=1247379 RepID=M1PY05_9VIRU|nr:hypothetical protein QJ854_gp115 [Moumouvirus goulette]AGF85667.1 hypothetical protein glt_00864 [Moumouvirus goulette]
MTFIIKNMENITYIINGLFDYNGLYIIPVVSIAIVINFILFFGLGKSRRNEDVFNELKTYDSSQELLTEIITTANNSFRRSSTFHLIFISVLSFLTIYIKLYDYLIVSLLCLIILRMEHVFTCWTRIFINSSGIHIFAFIFSLVTSLFTLIFLITDKNKDSINYIYTIIIMVGLIAPYLYASPLYFISIDDDYIIVKMIYIGLDLNHNLFGVETLKIEINMFNHLSFMINQIA